LRLKFVTSFFILFSFASHASFAAETLDSLQQDVILAKQKHQEIVNKVGSARQAMDVELSKAQQAEKETIASAELTLKAPASQKIDRKLEAPPKQSYRETLESQPARRVVTALPAVDEESPLEKLWNLPGKLFPSKKKKPASLRPSGQAPSPTPIQDAEALFKVAISDNKITVDEAVEIGLADNPRLKAAKMSVEVADAKLTEAKRGMFPTLQYVYERNGGKVPGFSGHRFYKGKNQKVNLTQPLYYGGELANTVKQAEENLRVAKAEYKKAKDDLVHELRVAYYGVVKAEYNAEYQLELFERIGALLTKVRAEREMRLSTEIDFLIIESKHYQVLYQVEASKNDVLSANVSLKQSLGLEIDGVIPVDLKMDFVKVNPKFEPLLERALQSNADIRVRAYAVEAAKYGIDIYKSKKKPHFDLRGSFGMLGEAFHDTEAFEDGKASIDPEKEWFLGVHGTMPLGPNSVEYEQIKHVYGPTVLALTGSEDWRHSVRVNLFDKFGDITDEKQAEYALLQAESEYKAVRDEVTLRLRDEFYSLQRYLIQIDSSIAKLRYQKKNLEIQEYLMSLQETALEQYLDDLLEQVQDRFAFIQAVADYNVSLSAVGLLIGDPFYFENQRQISPQKYEASDLAEAEPQ
jgi:outer membrane protein TolC